MRSAILPAALAVLTLPVFADSIATDRPNVVESSLTVGAGVLQLETGLAFETFDGGNFEIDTFSTPTLLRFGIGKAWEAIRRRR